MTFEQEAMVIKEELELMRMHELSKACVGMSESLLERDGLNEYFKHMVNRWVALTERIMETSEGKEYEWDEAIAIKLMFMEFKEHLTRLDDNKILPKASMTRLNSELDSILEGMKDVII